MCPPFAWRRRSLRLARGSTWLAALLCLLSAVRSTAAESPWSVVRSGPGTLAIALEGQPFCEYRYADAEISRPFFCNLTEPGGVRISRNHPPAPDDPQDHELLHPGMWLAFGDLSGADSWRLTAPVKHVRFVQEPRVEGQELRMAVENAYLQADGKTEVCRETCVYRFLRTPAGALALWDSTFRSDQGAFGFGDQEELGLGVRLNRLVAVKGGAGGRILTSNGERNEKEAWSKMADWCDYSGQVGPKCVGMTIMPHPGNFRKSWCHCRDNGFMAMNPFGANAFTQSDKSWVEVPAGKDFRLRYGVMVHWGDAPCSYDPAAAFAAYVAAAGED